MVLFLCRTMTRSTLLLYVLLFDPVNCGLFVSFLSSLTIILCGPQLICTVWNHHGCNLQTECSVVQQQNLVVSFPYVQFSTGPAAVLCVLSLSITFWAIYWGFPVCYPSLSDRSLVTTTINWLPSKAFKWYESREREREREREQVEPSAIAQSVAFAIFSGS